MINTKGNRRWCPRLAIEVSQDNIRHIVKRARVKTLSLPVPPRIDHADHIIKTALEGHTKLAADHILHPEMAKKLLELVSAIIRRVNMLFIELDFRKELSKEVLEEAIIVRYRLYDTLFEIAWNLVGIERKWAGFSEKDAEKAVNMIMSALSSWETLERNKLGKAIIMKTVIEEQLRSMSLVNKGNSMLAWIAGEVLKELKEDDLAKSYIKAMSRLIKTNFYYKAYEKGLCKFGNDYALGLRWLRHLGYVQVSTNPALAARAYDDDPGLWEAFKEYARKILAKEYPEWFNEPEKYADDIAMEATRFALMDNFYVFRIPFILSKYHDGLVSYQLNPLIADNVEKSIKAAREFAQRLEKDLVVYDSYLFWGYKDPIERGRPNLVIKVAAGYPAALEIARKLNEMGIGQNITVSYTVSQEVLIGVAALEGMAKAIKMGIIPTQTYDTNMGGRLEDHLRESVAGELLLKALEKIDDDKKEEILDKLARGLGVKDDVINELKTKPIEERISFLMGKRVLGRNMLKEAYVEALVETSVYGDREAVLKMLTPLENAIKLSGTYVAKRVYEILFAPWNKPKWIEYLINKYGITKEEAEFVLDRIDLLPASKRKPIDTLYTFAGRNMTNTEFPNHQLAVLKESMKENFNIEDYRESILQKLDEEPLKILMKLEDFVKAYEASPELNELLKKIGIKGDYGNRGIKTMDWPKYGPCMKTLKEFTKAYLKFREKVVKTIKEIAQDISQ